MNVDINKEQIEKAIVNQVVDELMDNSDFFSLVKDEVARRAETALAKGIDDQIEIAINNVMEKALDSEIQPVNTWGEREGEPTTIRGALHDRAKNFWTEKVDRNGKASGGYNCTPRYEHVLGVITAKEFESQIKQNITDIAGAIKDAIRDDLREQVDKHLDGLFKVKSAFDQGRKK